MARRWRRAFSAAALAVASCFASIVFAPQLLAFPYKAQLGRYSVWSETPIPLPAMRTVLGRADARLATSAINRPEDPVRLFLTRGGWRWRLLSLQTSDAFALTRAFNGDLLLNRSSVADDRVENGAQIGGVRPLSQVIAHEETHNLLRRHFGNTVDMTAPAWKREGYCDHIAGGGSLSDADAADLERRGIAHPALLYFHGRKRVAAALAADPSVDALFAD